MGVKLGILSKMYINDGTYGSPVWLEIALIGDATVNGSWDQGEANTRRSQVKESEPTLLGLEITGRIRVDPDDTAFNDLREAWLTKGLLDILALNGGRTINGSHGFRFDAKVFNWNEDQALGNVLFKDFNLLPCVWTNEPKSVLITGGAIVMSDIGADAGS